MTGRELIIYILENNLEDVDIFKDGNFKCFPTVEEAACSYGYGIETMLLLAKLNNAPIMKIGDKTYILGNPSKWS